MMKKSVLLIVLAVLLIGVPALAQTRNQIVSIHVTDFLSGKVSAVYEQKTSHNSSYDFGAEIWGIKDTRINYKGTAFKFSFSYNFYPEGKALNGAYVFPMASTAWANGKSYNDSITSGNAAIGLGGGYQYIFSNDITLNASLALTLPLHYFEFGDRYIAEDILPGGTDLRVAVGYAF